MTVHVHDLVVTTGRAGTGPRGTGGTGGTVLVDVSDVRLEPGRPVTIVGESGSGKSLLAHAVMGTLAPDLALGGRMTVDRQPHDLADRRQRQRLWGRTLALLPQEPVLALDPTMRAGEQVAEGAASMRSAGRAGRPEARRRASALLASLGLAAERRAYPHTLSGGMAQRVALAAATIGGATVLIADEPSKGLDPRARAGLAELLLRHVRGGGALLTITHDLDLARALGGDVLVMRAATVVERGPAERVLHQPTHPYTRRLLAAKPARWDPTRHHDHRPARTSPALITGLRLTKAFGAKQLFADLDVTIHAGERVALNGPSGAGKTTLGNVLLRLIPPDAGQVHHAEALRDGRLQKLYQDPAHAFPARVALRDALGDVLRRHRRPPARLHELLAALRVDPGLLLRRPGQVSGGELQRLALLRAMLLEPHLIFADEPTSRLDLITQQDTIRCLTDQLDRTGCALLLVTHDRTLAAAVADRELALTQQQPADA